MDRVEIAKLFADIEFYAEKTITVCGWIRTIRDSKALGFVDLNDGSCFKGLQVVLEEQNLTNFKDIVKLNVGAAVSVTGTIILTPEMKQPFEMHAQQVEVEGASTPDYPLQKKPQDGGRQGRLCR